MAYNCQQYTLTMLKARNQRIKTDYSIPPSSFPHTKQPPQTRRKSTISHDRQTYITRTLSSINHEVPYERLSVEQIEQQRNQLKLKVKEMNGMINGMIAKQMDNKFDQSRVSKKATIVDEMGMDYSSISREVQGNHAKIERMQSELQENEAKLKGISNLQSKVEYGKKVGELQARIRQLRQQLGRIRKNKLLREKQIMRGNVRQNEQIQHLQQEYITTNKKVDMIAARIQTVQQELVDSEFSLDKQKEYYDELKADYVLIDFSAEKELMAQQEEMSAIYQARKRKLDLVSKRNEKDIQGKKKKYYNLLLEYQQFQAKQQRIVEKASAVAIKNQATLQILSRMLAQLKNLSARPAAKSTHHYHLPDADFFQLTRAREELHEMADNQMGYSSKKLIVQNQLNRGNAKNRSLVRKWKLQGSIVHQNITPQGMRLMNSTEQAESQQEENEAQQNSHMFRSGTANDPKAYRSSKISGQIRHFKTENSPNLSFVKTQMEEYQDDFQS